jgi:MinD-like ATPase involved in chromosome partitioning or flagellar assembly
MAEPEVALVFTAEAWVEELHRHLTNHGGARVRQVVVEPTVALEEEYDVLVASHRWPALTRAFVADVHARGRSVLGVYDREEPAARDHLVGLGVDDVHECDAGPQALADAVVALPARPVGSIEPVPVVAASRPGGRTIVVGGPPGSGRTEIAVALAAALRGALVDADDVSPSIAARLGLPVEPNLRTAVDALEHGSGSFAASVLMGPRFAAAVVGGLPSAAAWSQLRPSEVVRVVEHLAREHATVVVDGPGLIEDTSGGTSRNRFALGRALLVHADLLVAVGVANPIGIARLVSWVAEARRLVADIPIVAVVNRAPNERFRRGDLYDELARSLPVLDVVFVPDDRRVADAAWAAAPVLRGPFPRAIAVLAESVRA